MTVKLRSVNTHFWEDGYIIDLDQTEKLLFLYFLTNPMGTIGGFYEIPLRRIAFDTGIDPDKIIEITDKFASTGKIIYRDSWVVIKNYLKNQKLNDNMKTSVANLVNVAPEWVREAILPTIETLLKPSKAFESLSKPSKAFESLREIESEVEVEVESEKEREVAVKTADHALEVFEFWKTTLNHSKAVFDKRRETKIKARLREFTPDQLKQAIRGVLKSPWHLGTDPKSTRPYDGIETIFRDAAQVETFMALEAGTSTNGSKPHGCDICLNSEYRERMSLRPGEIYDTTRNVVTRCECSKI